MSDFVTGKNGEIGVSGFGGNKGFTDEIGGRSEAVGVGGTDVDLLDLESIID